jgi:hypothetical protein
VTEDGLSYKLDPAGNAKAAALVPTTGKKSKIEVEITGAIAKDTVQVDALSLAK